MLDRERERRAEQEAEEARLAQEELQLMEEAEVVPQQNKQFLEKLKIPEYFQRIIDEDRLKGAYVLWRLPGLSGDILVPRPNQAKPTQGKVFVSGVALVWDIDYTPSHVIEDRALARHLGKTSLPEGYHFRYIEALGGKREDLLILCYNSLARRRYQGFYKRGERFIPDPHDPLEAQIPKIGQVFTREEFDDPQMLQQLIASLYLDYPKSDSYGKIFSKTWPFDKPVPEMQLPQSQA